MRDLARILFVAELLWIVVVSQATAAERIPIPAVSSRPPSQAPSILIDGHAQTLTFDLGSIEIRNEVAGVSSSTRTCNGTTATGVPFSYECPYSHSYTRDVPVAEILNRVTVVIPEAATQLAPLDELLDISQEGITTFVSPRRTSKRVLIFTQAETKTTRFDRDTQVKELATTVQVHLVDPAEVTRPMSEGMSDISLDGPYLSYKIGRVTYPSLLAVKIRMSNESLPVSALTALLFRAPPIQYEYLLKQGTENAFVLRDQGERFSRVIVDLSQLGAVPLMRGRSVSMEIQTILDLPDGLANRGDVPLPFILQADWKAKVPKDWCPDL